MQTQASLAFDSRELDKLSAKAGSVLSRLVMEHSPVVFGCRFSAEDMVVLDLIGRYRFPVRVIAWDTGLTAAESERFDGFLGRRYVFASPVTHVRDERLDAKVGFGSTAEALDWLTVAFTGCRGWIESSRHGTAREDLLGDTAHRVARAAPLAHWSDADVHAYIERWELPFRKL